MEQFIRLVVAACVGFALLHLINVSVLGNTGDALPENERMGNWRNAQIREQCMDATENPLADLQFPRRDPSSPYSIVAYNNALTTMAAMHCYVVSNATAICNPDNRAYIVYYADKYFDRRAEMFSESAKRNDVGRAEALWNNPRTRAIDASLKGHIESGRLQRDDFGWSAPEPLLALLEQNEGKPDSCSKTAGAL